MDSVWNLVFLPVGLGLLGFVEQCSIGSSLLFIRYMKGHGQCWQSCSWRRAPSS